MAKQDNSTSDVKLNTFNKGLYKDGEYGLVPDGAWTHARNAVHNTEDGRLGVLSSEIANTICQSAPYTIIGTISLGEGRWAIYSTDNQNSEIGIFDEKVCSYITVVNDPCLAFSTQNLIKGVSKGNFDCTTQVYWDDGKNPSRTMNLDEPPFKKIATTVNDCTTYDLIYPLELDCEELRLAKLVSAPCVKLNQLPDGGTLVNGTYQVFIAYTIDQQRVTDYIGVSNLQSLFTHDNGEGSLEVTIGDLDQRFDQFELALIVFANEQTEGRRIGYYDTRTSRVVIDYFDNSLPVIPTANLVISNPAFEKSEAMFEANGYLFRVAPTGKFDFNYQPIANNITTKWVSVEYSTDYYHNGGNVVGYLRDEQYAFFIRWVYNTGDKSASYHIPGRVSTASDLQITQGADALPVSSGSPRRWQVYNTAAPLPTVGGILPDGGVIIKEGRMGYWESVEQYPDDRPDIWGPLCGKPIRHHKFPEECTDPSVKLINDNKDRLRVLGVRFENIKPPVDNQGNIIPGIVGYEILRATRDGNKSIVAKGIINNMGEYEIPNSNGRKSLYPNYPYNDLRIDPFLSTVQTDGACKIGNHNGKSMGTFRDNAFTFHSPDTSFKNPFLSPTELKVYGEYKGLSTGNFDTVEGHPKHKLLRNTAFFLSSTLALGYTLTQMHGKTTTKVTDTSARNEGSESPVGTGTRAATAAGRSIAKGIAEGILAGALALVGDVVRVADLFATGGTLYPVAVRGARKIFNTTMDVVPMTNGSTTERTYESSETQEIPTLLRVVNATWITAYHMSNGANRTLDIIQNILPYRQYAYHYKSHGYYNDFLCVANGNRRRLIDDSVYLRPQIQEFSLERVNNLYRSDSVGIKLTADLARPSTVDTSRYTIGTNNDWKEPTKTRSTTISSLYAGLKYNLENQYGQLYTIRQVPITNCVQKVTITSPGQTFKSDILFGGDTYVGRYTEKNTFFYFYNWMMNQPDGTEFDYRQYVNVAYPWFWMNSEKYDFTEFFSGLARLDFSNAFPNDDYALDGDPTKCNLIGLSLAVKNRYFYLFNSGIRDFWVESEVNLAQRDHEDTEASRFYNHKEYTDLDSLFRPSQIKVGNFWKYDYSLSVNKYWGQLVSWGSLQTQDYDPTVSSECYVKVDNRVLYSLPETGSSKKDGWRVFLPLNYYDFSSKVVAIKEINETGSLILFNSAPPMQFRGVDTLKTDNNVKITIGDGGLFANSPQRIVNADTTYEYGSCQDRLSVISTPAGVFWTSQNQGRIFLFAGQLLDLGATGMKWWLHEYMPYKITDQFPTYTAVDNPVDGVGMQTTYDNTDAIVYFCKKDFIVKQDYKERVTYIGDNYFFVDNMLTVKGGDPLYFDDASWTLSFDTKTKEFVSFHDWHPYLSMPSTSHFLTTYDNEIYKHNQTCDRFCTFYGVDYPFEIEVTSTTGANVSTVRSFEYQLEAHQYRNDCRDTHHVLDSNFDQAIVFNTEQISGLLRLNLTPKNNAPLILTYPRTNLSSIDILYSKEENKFRFNQFWDITRDRGEFTNTRLSIFNTEPNGYIRQINLANVDYAKPAHQHKKFRQTTNSVLLRRTVCGPDRLSIKINNTKVQYSLR